MKFRKYKYAKFSFASSAQIDIFRSLTVLVQEMQVSNKSPNKLCHINYFLLSSHHKQDCTTMVH